MQKAVLITVLVWSSLQYLSAQELSIPSDWSNLALKSIDQSLFLIRTDYILEETNTGNFFGRNSQPYFNRKYTLGVLVGDVIWVDAEVAAMPWKDDPLFDAYLNSTTFRPVVNLIMGRPIAQVTFDTLIRLDSLLSGTLFKFRPFGNVQSLTFAPPTLNDQKGICIYLRMPQNLIDNDTLPLKPGLIWTRLAHYAYEQGKEINLERPLAENQLIGGVFFNPEVSSGAIHFQAVGILGQNTTGEWNRIKTFSPPPRVDITPLPSGTVPPKPEPSIVPTPSMSPSKKPRRGRGNS